MVGPAISGRSRVPVSSLMTSFLRERGENYVRSILPTCACFIVCPTKIFMQWRWLDIHICWIPFCMGSFSARIGNQWCKKGLAVYSVIGSQFAPWISPVLHLDPAQLSRCNGRGRFEFMSGGKEMNFTLRINEARRIKPTRAWSHVRKMFTACSLSLARNQMRENFLPSLTEHETVKMTLPTWIMHVKCTRTW